MAGEGSIRCMPQLLGTIHRFSYSVAVAHYTADRYPTKTKETSTRGRVPRIIECECGEYRMDMLSLGPDMRARTYKTRKTVAKKLMPGVR